MLGGQVPIILPQRIVRDVGHEDGPALEGRGAAGADGGADRDPVDGLVVGVGQAGGGAVQQALSGVVEDEDRAEHPVRGLRLDAAPMVASTSGSGEPVAISSRRPRSDCAWARRRSRSASARTRRSPPCRRRRGRRRPPGLVADRAVRPGEPGLLRIAVRSMTRRTRSFQVASPFSITASAWGPTTSQISSHVSRAGRPKARGWRWPEDGDVGVVVDVDELAAPPDEHREPRAQADAHGEPQALRPLRPSGRAGCLTSPSSGAGHRSRWTPPGRSAGRKKPRKHGIRKMAGGNVRRVSAGLQRLRSPRVRWPSATDAGPRTRARAARPRRAPRARAP